MFQHSLTQRPPLCPGGKMWLQRAGHCPSSPIEMAFLFCCTGANIFRKEVDDRFPSSFLEWFGRTFPSHCQSPFLSRYCSCRFQHFQALNRLASSENRTVPVRLANPKALPLLEFRCESKSNEIMQTFVRLKVPCVEFVQPERRVAGN